MLCIPTGECWDGRGMRVTAVGYLIGFIDAVYTNALGPYRLEERRFVGLGTRAADDLFIQCICRLQAKYEIGQEQGWPLQACTVHSSPQGRCR